MKRHLAIQKLNKGFTLIELLLVVVLISVLSGLVISAINVNALRARARDSQRSADIKKIALALELYFADNRVYPVNSGAFSNATTVLGGPLTNYMNPLVVDPRDSEAIGSTICGKSNYRYYYRTDAGGGRYVLFGIMEKAASVNAADVCSALSNCSNNYVSGCSSCSAPCYGVQNPL